MDTGSRLLVGLLAAVVLAGGVWLVWTAVSGEPRAVVGGELNRDQRNRAAVALRRQGIEVRRSDGALTVPREQLGEARRVLRSDRTIAGRGRSNLQQLADDSGLWQTDRENRRRWQAGMMAELSRLVTEMEPVADASVLFEPPADRTLGRPARRATAAVKVTLAKGRHMSPSLIVAIADLLCGGIAGIEPNDVRIVDQAGRSYRASAATRSLAERHAVEAYYQGRILSALRYVPDVSADVQIGRAVLDVPAGDPQNRIAPNRAVGVRVRISVPRNCLPRAHSDRAAAAQLADIKRIVTAILPGGARHDVAVSVRSPAGISRLSARSSTDAAAWVGPAAGILIVIAGGALGVLLVRRWWKYRSAARRGRGSDVAGCGDEAGYEMLLPFSETPPGEPGEALEREHPQTLAMILVQMSAVEAAEIMSRLPAAIRAEVASRMADLDDADPGVVSEIREELARRLETEPHRLTPPAQEPESFDRRKAEQSALRLPVFEDMTCLSAAQLRAALGMVEPDDLAISLRTAGRQLRKRVLACLSTKDGTYVRTRMDRIGPMRLCDVESARQRVMQTVMQAAGNVPTSARPEAPQVLEDSA